MSNLPTINELLMAYQQTGFEPICNTFVELVDGKLCACPLTALLVDKGLLTKVEQDSWMGDADGKDPCMIIRQRLNLSFLEVAGFFSGFDGKNNSLYEDGYQAAYDLGQTLRKTLNPKESRNA